VGKKITIAPQIGGAVAGAGDLFSTTKGPDKSGTHLQSVGVVNLQVDYKLSKSLSVTGTFGYQKGIDLGPQKPQGIENFTYSLVLTLHIP
jgi:hypothetical protein